MRAPAHPRKEWWVVECAMARGRRDADRRRPSQEIVVDDCTWIQLDRGGAAPRGAPTLNRGVNQHRPQALSSAGVPAYASRSPGHLSWNDADQHQISEARDASAWCYSPASSSGSGRQTGHLHRCRFALAVLLSRLPGACRTNMSASSTQSPRSETLHELLELTAPLEIRRFGCCSTRYPRGRMAPLPRVKISRSPDGAARRLTYVRPQSMPSLDSV